MVPSPKMGSGKILANEKLPGSQLCPNMLCVKSLSWPLESYVTDSPRNHWTQIKLYICKGHGLSWQHNWKTNSDMTSWGYAPCFKLRIPNSLPNFMWLSAFHSSTHTHTHTHTNSMGKKVKSNQENGLRPTFEKNLTTSPQKKKDWFY